MILTSTQILSRFKQIIAFPSNISYLRISAINLRKSEDLKNKNCMNIEIVEKSWQDWKVFDRIQMHDGYKHTHYVYRERIMADAKRKGLKFKVAFENEKPVGFCAYYFGVFPTLQFLSVVEENKNQGIEKILVDEVIKEVKEKKLTKIRVFAEAGTGIEKMYEACGFKKAGFTPSRFGKGRDAIVMLIKL